MNRTKMLLGCKYSRIEEDEAGYIRVYDLTTPEEVVAYLYENGICVTEIHPIRLVWKNTTLI